jgi:hypothetical protein
MYCLYSRGSRLPLQKAPETQPAQKLAVTCRTAGTMPPLARERASSGIMPHAAACKIPAPARRSKDGGWAGDKNSGSLCCTSRRATCAAAFAAANRSAPMPASTTRRMLLSAHGWRLTDPDPIRCISQVCFSSVAVCQPNVSVQSCNCLSGRQVSISGRSHSGYASHSSPAHRLVERRLDNL